jgi:predicted transcriptional regulator
MSNNELVLEAVNELSDDASMDEFVQSIQSLDAIRRGERAADNGQIVTHEELKARVATWTTK